MQNASRRVLVVEDNPGLAHAIEFSFRQAGYHVTVRHDGEAAWDSLQQDAFDAVVTDHEMPGMTGIELCRQMRASRQHAGIPVVLVTGRKLELDTQRLQPELNLAAVYPKPFSPRTLVALIRGIVPLTPLPAVS